MRRSRQVRAEILASSAFLNEGRTQPITLFTGSWVAQLLGYGRKYRSTKLIETFTAVAVRSYLLLYYFVPFALSVQGPFANFNFFWRNINMPANQVFVHPIMGSIVWDLRFPKGVHRTKDDVRGWLTASLLEFGRTDAVNLESAFVDDAIKNLVGPMAGPALKLS